MIRLERVNRLNRFTGLPGKQSYRHLVRRNVQQRETVLFQDFAVRLVRQPNSGLAACRVRQKASRFVYQRAGQDRVYGVL